MTAAKKKPAKKIAIPTAMADVPAWCEQLRARRLNAEGVAAIDVMEMIVRNMIAACEACRTPAAHMRHIATAAPLIEKQFRVALAADRAQADLELIRLRNDLENQRKAERCLEAMH